MDALINGKIPEQGFEKVLYQIAAIIFVELQKQKSDFDNLPDFSVYLERMTAYDKSEGVMINITTNSANYGNFTERDSQGKTDFHIEVYAPLEHVFISAGDVVKRFTLHKVMGLIRYILQDTRYVILGFPPGLIGGTYVESLNFFDDFNNQDGANIRMATMVFSTRIQENQNLWEGVELLLNSCQIKIGETEKGYKLIKNT